MFAAACLSIRSSRPPRPIVAAMLAAMLTCGGAAPSAAAGSEIAEAVRSALRSGTGLEVISSAEPCLNVRPRPAAVGGRFDCVPTGTTGSVIDVRGEWLKVRWAGRAEGWVAAKFVDAVGSDSPGPSAAPASATGGGAAMRQLEAELDRTRGELERARSEEARLRARVSVLEARLAATESGDWETTPAPGGAAGPPAPAGLAAPTGGSTVQEPLPSAAAVAVTPDPLEPAVPLEPLGRVPLEPLGFARSSAATDSEILAELVEAWARAWSERRIDDYLGFYSRDFRPADGLDRGEWEARRRQRLSRPSSIEVSVSSLETMELAPDRATVRFAQSLSADSQRDRVLKVLDFVREDGAWKIVAEQVERPASPADEAQGAGGGAPPSHSGR